MFTLLLASNTGDVEMVTDDDDDAMMMMLSAIAIATLGIRYFWWWWSFSHRLQALIHQDVISYCKVHVFKEM